MSTPPRSTARRSRRHCTLLGCGACGWPHTHRYKDMAGWCSVVLGAFLVIACAPVVRAASSCGSFGCNPTPTCVTYGDDDGLPGNRPFNDHFVIGLIGGTSGGQGSAYNDSRVGRLSTARIGGSVKKGSSGCGSQGQMVTPPYDEDMFFLMVDRGACFWVAGAITTSNQVSFTGITGSSGFYSYSCDPSSSTKSPIYGRPLGTQCKNALIGAYGDGGQRAYESCIQPAASASALAWQRLGDGWEELRMPYLLTADLAASFCQSVGGDLGTVRNGSHAASVYASVGEEYWVGYRCGSSSASCAWVDGASSSVSIVSPTGGNKPNALRLDSGNYRISQRGTNVWNAFLCSRQIQSVAVAFSGDCYRSLSCTVVASPSTMVQWYHLADDSSQLQFQISMAGAPAFTVGFLSQQTAKSSAITAPSSAGVKTVQISLVGTGYNFNTVQSTTLTVKEFEQVALVGAGTVATFFGNQTFTFTATKPTSHTISLTGTSPPISTVTWAGNTATITATATTASASLTTTFTVSGQPFYFTTTSPVSRTFVILQQSTVAITSSASAATVLVHGDQFTITATVSSAISVAGGTFTITPVVSPGDAPVSLVSGSLSWSQGQSGSKVLTYQCTNPGTSATPITITLSYSHVQFVAAAPAPALAYTIRPKLAIAMTASGTYTTGVSGIVTAVVTRVYTTGVSFVLTCAGATITPAASPAQSASATSVTVTFTIASSTSLTCTMGVTSSGATSGYYLPSSTVVARFTEEPVISAGVNASTIYALQGGEIQLQASPAISLGGNQLVVQVALTAATGVTFLSSTTLTMTQGSPNVVLPFSTRLATVGNVSFTVVQTVGQFPTTIPSIEFTVTALDAVAVGGPLLAQHSIGAAYAQVLTFTLPALPEGVTSATGVVQCNESAFALAPSNTFTWSGSDSSLSSRSITVIAQLLTTNAPFSVTFDTSTSAKLNRTTLHLGTVSTYRRANVNASLSRNVTYGALPVTLTVATNRAPVTAALNVSCTIPADLGGGVANLMIGVGMLSANATFVPVAQSSASGTFGCTLSSTSTTETAQYEAHMVAQTCTVLPLRTTSVSCNDTRLYFAPNNALLCTVTVQLSLTNLQAFPTASAFTTFSVGQLGFASATSQSLVVYPVTSVSVQDGATTTIAFTLSDNTFAPCSTTVVLKERLTVSLVLPQFLYVGTSGNATANAFLLEMTVSTVPDIPSIAGTVSLSLAGLSFNTSSVTFSSTQPKTQHVLCWGLISDTYSFTFAISGTAAFAATTGVVSRQLRPLVRVSIFSLAPSFVFTGQNATASLSISDVLPNAEMTVTLRFVCNGVDVTSSTIDVPPAVFASSTTNAALTLTALSDCSANGVVKATVASAASIVDTSTILTVPFLVLAQKNATLTAQPVLYCGGLNRSTVALTLEGPPNASFYCVQLAVQSSLVVLATPDLNVTMGSTTGTLTTSISAPTCPASPTFVTVTPTLQSSIALSEFRSADVTSPFVVEVRPLLRATLPSVLPRTSLYVGESLQFNVTLPELPVGGDLTMTLSSNASLAVTVSPSVFSFTTSTPLSLRVTINVTAISQTWIAISADWTGTASQYLPHPATSWVLQFLPLGVVALSSTLPTSLFAGASASPVVMTSTILPPSPWTVTVTIASSNASAAAAVPSQLAWNVSTGQLAAVWNVVPLATAAAPVVFTLSLSAPSMFAPFMNVQSFSVLVVSSRSIVWTVPAVLYLGAANTVQSRITINVLPPPGQTLGLSPSVSGQQASSIGVNSINPFSASTSTSQEVGMQGFAPMEDVFLTLTLTSGAALYDAPAPVKTSIRALETVGVSGLPSRMYVGSSITFNISVTRLPVCTSGTLVLAPTTNQPSSASFSVSSVAFAATDTTLVRQVTVAAVAATLVSAPVQLTFPYTGTCTSIYATTAMRLLHVFNLEAVTMSLPSTYMDGTSYFVYQGNTLALTISLGTPSIYHDANVVLQLQYLGPNGAVGFSSSTVVLGPGINATTVTLTGMAPTGSSASLVVTVVEGAAVFATTNTLQLRVLPRIALTVTLPQSPMQFFVRNVASTVTIAVDSTALYGALSVTLGYGPEVHFGTATFAALSATLSGTISVNATALSSNKTLSLQLSGPGAGGYEPTVTEWPNVRVVPVHAVNVTCPAELFVGSDNAQVVWFSIPLPDLAHDVVTITLSGRQQMSWNATTVVLTRSKPTAAASITGLFAGELSLSPLMSVESTSSQYAAAVDGPSSITIVGQRALTVLNYLPVLFDGDNQTIVVHVPYAPLNGSLLVTPRVSNGDVVFSPATLLFNATSTSLNLTMTVTGVFSTTFTLETEYSSEYLAVAASQPLQVNSGNQTTRFNFKTRMYVGAANQFAFGVSIHQAPPNGGTMTIGMSSSVAGRYTLSPSTLIFNSSRPLTQYVTVVGLAAVENSQLFFTTVDTSNFFERLSNEILTVLPLETFGGSISRNLVYVGLTTTISLTLTDGPKQALTMNLVMQQPRQDNQNAYTLISTNDYAVQPASTLILVGNTTVSITITALASGLTPHITFTVVKNAESVRYDLTTLPVFDIRFVPLRTVAANCPTTLYVGLVSTATVVLGSAPDNGTSLSVTASSTTPTVTLGSTVVTFLPGDLSKHFQATPSALGLYTIVFAVNPSSNNDAYAKQTTPSTWTFAVQMPSVVTLVGVPTAAYVGVSNLFYLNVSGYGTMSPGETLHVNLTCNASTTSIFPTEVETSSMTPSFAVHATAVGTVVCNMSFRASINRFVSDSRFLPGGRGLIVPFLPLKTATVSAPSLSAPYVNQLVSLTVTITRMPSLGRTLIATLVYGGSSANVELSPAVSWTSQSASTSQSLFIKGLSPTDANAISVALSGDTEYAALHTSYSIVFQAYLLIDVTPPLQGYVDQVSAITFYLREAKVVTVGISFSIPTAMRVVNSVGNPVASSSIQWVFQDARFKTGYLQCLTPGDVTVFFTVSGQDAAAFAVPAPVVVTCVPITTVLVNAPANDITMYLSPTFFARVTVQVLFRPVTGTLVVTPTLTCTASTSPIVTMSQPIFYFNASYALQQTVDLFGAVVGGPCDLSFPLSGNTTGYIGNRRFTVTVRPLINVSIGTVPSEVYLGTANRVPLTFSLDASATIPLAFQVNVSLVTSAAGSLCISVSPTSIFWAALSATETLTKTITVTATCTSQDAQVIGVSVDAAPNIYLNTLPTQIVLYAKPLVDVTVASIPAGERNFNLYVGGAAMPLIATLGDNLTSTESLEVSVVYRGAAGSISTLSAVWLPSPVFTAKKQMILSPQSVSPNAVLQFVVVGPPRFNTLAPGSWTLQVIGLLAVKTSIPSPMVVGNTYEITFTLGGSRNNGESLTIQPVWYGAHGALTWSPSTLAFTDADSGLQKTMVLRANAFQAGYRLLMRVSGSNRFVSVAFDSIIAIDDAIQMISVALPTQLMRGQSYALGINVRALPLPGATVTVRTTTISGPQCITFPSGSTFSFVGTNPTAPLVQTVPVEVIKIKCDTNDLPFEVLGTSDLSYSRSIPSRKFSTVSPGVISLDWPPYAYLNDANAVTALVLLVVPLEGEQSYVNVVVTASSTLSMSTRNVTFRFGGTTSYDIVLSRNASATVTFSFAILTSDTFPASETTIPQQTTQFLSLIPIVVAAQPSNNNLYTGVDNMQVLALRLDTAMQALDNREARIIRIDVQTSSSNLTAQPRFLQWSVGYNTTQFVYLVGSAPQLGVVVSFALSGTGASAVASVPASIPLSLVEPLKIEFSKPPASLYVGAVNAVRLNVTLPSFHPSLVGLIVVKVVVVGDADSLAIEPPAVSWVGGPTPNFTRSASVTIRGEYATSSPKIISFSMTTGPPWIEVVPHTAGTVVYDLQTVVLDPPRTSYTYYVQQTHLIKYYPTSLTVSCTSTNPFIVGAGVSGGHIVLETRLPGFVRIFCSVNDTSFTAPPILSVSTLLRKVVLITPTVLYTYVGVPNSFTVLVDPLPSTILVLSPIFNFTTEYFTMAPSALTFGPTSNRDLSWSVSGVALSPASAPVDVPLSVVGPLDEFSVETQSITLQVQILPYLTVTIRSVNVDLTGSSSSSPFMWYRTMNNMIELQFSIPRGTVFKTIRIAPDLEYDPTSSLRFCATSQGCTQSSFTTAAPLVLDKTTIRISMFVYATTPALRELVFRVINAEDCVDYGGSPSLYAGTVHFRELEWMVVDPTSMRDLLYIGTNNSQVLRIAPTGIPLGSSAAEIVMTVPGNMKAAVLSAGDRFSFTDRGNGQFVFSWTSIKMDVYVRITGLFRSTGRVQIFFSWRNTPSNYFPTFTFTTVNVTVVPPIQYGVQIPLTSGTVTLSPTEPTAITVFMGVDNALAPELSTPTFAVLPSDVLMVSITAADPGVLSVNPSTVAFGLYANGGAKKVTAQLYALFRQNVGVVTTTVTFEVKEGVTPSEFNRTRYQVLLTIRPLQTLVSSLASVDSTVLAVGADNAVSFTLTPKLPVTLTLTALVTCAEVSFTPVDTLSWVNSQEAKRLRVSATRATGLSSKRCVIMTQTLPGGDRTTFEQPPFNATIYSLAKPQVVSPPQAVIPVGNDVAASGYNITLTLSGSYFTFVTGQTVLQLLANGGLIIQPARTRDEEPASFAALIARQQAGGAVFLRMFLDDTRRIMTLQFGPSTEFQPTTLEQVVVTVGRNAIAQAVSVDETMAMASFQVKGTKKELLGSTGGFIGSGTSAASIIGALVSMTSAQQANRLQTISQAFVCPNQDWKQQQGDFAWNDQLIPLSFGSEEDLGGFAAVGVSDLMVIVGIMVLHLGVAWGMYEHRKRGSYADKTFAAALAFVRFPSFLLVPVMFFYQTMVSSALTTIMYSPRLHLRMIGAFTLIAFGFGIPIATYTVIGPGFRAEYVTEAEARRRHARKRYATNLRSILGSPTAKDNEADDGERGIDLAATALNREGGDSPLASPKQGDDGVGVAQQPSDAEGSKDATQHDDLDSEYIEPPPVRRSAFGRFMLFFKPTGKWCYDEDPYWINRYELFFGEYRGGRHQYLAIDLSMTFLLGVVDGIQPVNVTQCLGRTSAYVVLFGLQFLSIVLLRPYNSSFGNAFFILAYFLQFLSMIFVSVAVFRNDVTWGGVTVAVNALIIFGTCLYCKTFLDFLQSINENFELEKFFEAREDLNVKQIQGKRAEAHIVRNFEAEMTTKMIQKQQDKQRENIGFMLRGPPVHDGRTLEAIEGSMLDADRKERPYDPTTVLAKYRGPEGGEADSDEEAILYEHEQRASANRPRVQLLEARSVAPHYYDAQEGRVKFVKRLDERFEKLLVQAQKKGQEGTPAAAAPEAPSSSAGGRSRANSRTSNQKSTRGDPNYDDLL